MTYHITADHLVDTASKAVTEELFAIRESDCTYCGNTYPKKMIRHVTHKDVS